MKFITQKYAIADEPMKVFIDAEEIIGILNNAKPDKYIVKDIIDKSLNKTRLTMQETAMLTNTSDPELVEMIKEGARTLKRNIYGNRIVLFAPLYIGISVSTIVNTVVSEQAIKMQ